MSTKTFIRNRFPRTYALLRKTYFFPKDYWKPSPGSIMRILEKFLAEKTHSNISFIQIGANNGDDEFASLRKQYRWTGIMVEPQKRVFDELIRSNHETGIAFEQVAIADRECETTLYKISFSNAAWATTLASFDKRVIEKHISDGWIAACAAKEGIDLPSRTEDYYTSEIVLCTTLKKLVEKHRLNALDILLVDTEGHDYEIVKQIGELGFRPRIVVFEHKHLSLLNSKACVRLLRTWEYELHADESNTIGLMG